MEIKPTIGRIVYYNTLGSADGVFPTTARAAMITDGRTVGIDEPVKEIIDLAVFHPYGIQFAQGCEQGDKPGNWDWMPFQKDQQARLATNLPQAATPAVPPDTSEGATA